MQNERAIFSVQTKSLIRVVQCPITLVYTVHGVRQWKVPFSTTVYYGNSWSKSHFTMLLTTAQTMVGVINNLSQILFPARGIRERSLLYYDKWPHYFLHHWYFVSKIVLTCCEKKIVLVIVKKDWRPRTSKKFEITRTIYSNSQGQN